MWVAMEESQEKEGNNLLGSPTFKKLENGRFRCVQTGHELLDKDKDSYSNSKRCRLGLIDYALTRNKPPLTMFNQHPSSRSKLVCKLTGDTVNKSEEHIWKHLNGKRFLNKLELVEAGKLTPDGALVDGEEQPADSSVNEKKKKNKKKTKKQKKKNKEVEQIISEERNSSDKESESEEIEFWMPPAGERWDFDDGKDRWGSDSESEEENNGADGSDGVVEDDDEGGAVEDDDEVSEEVSVRTKKRVIKEVGPSSSSSRKKKKKKKEESKQTVT